VGRLSSCSLILFANELGSLGRFLAIDIEKQALICQRRRCPILDPIHPRMATSTLCPSTLLELRKIEGLVTRAGAHMPHRICHCRVCIFVYIPKAFASRRDYANRPGSLSSNARKYARGDVFSTENTSYYAPVKGISWCKETHA